MWKKVLAVVVLLVAIAAGGLYFWARAIFASDLVRSAVEAQLTRALGQPVRIGRMGATVFPRVTMTLHDVRVGEPARVTADRLDVGTGLGALMSRRIERGAVQLTRARVELPLPPFAFGAGDRSASAAAPVTIVSIDDITLDDVTIVSGSRTLAADAELALTEQGLAIRRAAFSAGGTAVSLTGTIADLSGPRGELALTAPALDVLYLLGFVADFAAGASAPGGSTPPDSASSPPAAAAVDRTPMDLNVSLEAGRATLGTLTLDTLTGRARATPEYVRLDPIRFGVFGGRYDGTLAFSLADEPGFQLNASVQEIDLARFAAFAGHPDLITGRLGGRLDVAGRGTTADRVIASTSGTARVDATDGTIRGLGLVRAVVLAGSMRASSQAEVSGVTSVEPFTRLGATLAIAGATATTDDLRFESTDLLLDAAGSLRLDGNAVDLSGRVQLTDELSRKAGQDLLRYTAEDGRVTLPVAVSGPASNLSVRIDMSAVLKRAIVNRAAEEAKDAIKKGLGSLLGK
jgi:uncharacterized protein involved in outer membrane biogenesis